MLLDQLFHEQDKSEEKPQHRVQEKDIVLLEECFNVNLVQMLKLIEETPKDLEYQ